MDTLMRVASILSSSTIIFLHDSDMDASPDWATWSLESSKVAPVVIVSDHGLAQEGAPNGGANLFKVAAHDNVHDTEWQDFDEDGAIEGGMQLDASTVQGQDGIDVDELFKEVKDSRKGSESQERDIPDINQYSFDPLSPVESRALQRALKLSKYIPPSAQEVEEEKQRYVALKLANGKRGGATFNEETGKRAYHAASRGTGLVRKENDQNRDVFKAMCKSMLPRRHFDWILAQLTYHHSNMIGFDDVPSSRTILQQEAKESVANETMEMYNLAHVTRLLAEASKVDTSAFDIVDPTRAAREKGRPMTVVKHKMMQQSKAVFDALKELFPNHFQQCSAPDIKPPVE
jgi:hypothetical protein